MGLKIALDLLEKEGLPVELDDMLIINHWRVAIDSNKTNNPGARWICDDVFTTPPRKAIPEGYLDLLMASPTCTFFSRARGGKPISWDQRKGRMTPTQVVRWCRELDVKCLIVENVPEFRDWGPVCERRTSCKKHGWDGPEPGKRAICGKPDRARKGTLFRAWVKRLERLGYVVEFRVLNAANFGDATTRHRFYLIARKDGIAIEWPEATHSQDGADPERPGVKLKRWRSARKAIDWKIRGRSIFNRAKPLAAKTLLRILAGLKRFLWPPRFVRKLELYILSLGIALPTTPPPVTSGQLGLFPAPGVVVLRQHADVPSIDRPLPAVLAAGNHLGVVEPLVMRADCQGGNGHNTRGASDPIYTPTTNGGLAVVEPFVFPANQGKDRARGLRSVDAPLDTVVAKDMKGLVEPFVLNRHGDNGTSRTHPVDAPMPTATTRGAGYVVEPFVLSQGAGGAPRSVADSVPSIPTEGAHSLIAPYYGASECRSVDEPLGTVTTRDRFGLVVPVTHTDTSNRARDVDAPLPTVTGANRGELAFVTAAFGERPGQAPRNRSLDEPAPTICAKGRVPLVEGVRAPDREEAHSPPAAHVETLDDYADIDILFRMLEPHELANAMGFPKGYRFKGNKGERTRQIGNAVAVNTAAALVAAVLRTGLRARVAA